MSDEKDNQPCQEDEEEKAKIEMYIKTRLEPINELVSSERSYVERLRTVAEKYIPLIDDENVSIPDDLTNKWRILWGNWLQLNTWHSNFLEKLEKMVLDDPDLIPKLFLDSRARLRNIYSKYCENHRKASVIAEQYRDFFEERRVVIGDKQDVVSHLMQPVQRIMRYQLPMGLIVKLTGRAKLPSLSLWERALDVMKEIPKDTQLILEAARIDGFPHSITALGNIRIRGELSVALTTRADLDTCQQKWLTYNSVSLPNSNAANSTTTATSNTSTNTSASPQNTSGIPNNSSGGTPNFSNSLSSPHNNNSTTNSNSNSSNNDTANNVNSINSPLADLKFIDNRVFLFDQMLLFTEEVKLKKKDPFTQSTYMYKSSINVNKMKFQPRWNFSISNSNSSQVFSEIHQHHELIFLISDETTKKDKIYVIDPGTSENREQWVVELKDIQRMQQNFLLALEDPKRFAGKVDSDGDSLGMTHGGSDGGGTGTGGLASLSSFTGAVKSAFGGSSSQATSPTTVPHHQHHHQQALPPQKKSSCSSSTPTNKQKWPNFSSMTSAVANKGGNMLKKHLRPKSSSALSPKLPPAASKGKSHTPTANTTAPSNTVSDDSEDKSSSADSASTTGAIDRPNTVKCNVVVVDSNRTASVLNEDESNTIKQRAWSAFSFRLRRSKRDPKIHSQCYSKSDEMGLGTTSQVTPSFSPSPNQISPLTTPLSNTSGSPSTNSGSKKKGAGHIFQSMFSSGRHHHHHHHQKGKNNHHQSNAPSTIVETAPSVSSNQNDDNSPTNENPVKSSPGTPVASNKRENSPTTPTSSTSNLPTSLEC